MTVENVLDFMTRDINDLTIGQSADAVIHLTQYGDVKVAEIAWNQQRHDRSRSIRKHFVAACEPVEHKVNFRGLLTVLDNVGFGPIPPGMGDQLVETFAIVFVKNAGIWKFASKHICHDRLSGLSGTDACLQRLFLVIVISHWRLETGAIPTIVGARIFSPLILILFPPDA